MRILLLIYVPVGFNCRAHTLKEALENRGHDVDLLFNFPEGKKALQQISYCASIIVTGHKNHNCINEIFELRENGIKTPIIVLSYDKGTTVRSAIINAGADDCMDAPLPLDELMTRIHSIVRRSYSEPKSLLIIGDIIVNPVSRKIMKGGRLVKLTKSEFILFEILLLNTKRLVSRSFLEDRIFSWKKDVNSNVLDVHISNIRKKLGKNIIQTIKGQGYILSSHHNVTVERLSAIPLFCRDIKM